MPYLGREDILEADDIEKREVEVPEWGGTVIVRGLTGEERDDFEAEFAEYDPDSSLIEVEGERQKINLKNARARLVARCVVDEDGGRVFSDDDVRRLAKKSGKALDRVYDVAQELSGIREADLEEMQENLTEARNGDSLSG